jgi:hypothetical protein
MTEWDGKLVLRYPVGKRIGRIRCVSGGGGVIAWLAREDDGSITISRPPDKPVRRGSNLTLRIHRDPVATRAARSGHWLIKCPTCGTMEVSEEVLAAAIANGRRNGVVKL